MRLTRFTRRTWPWLGLAGILGATALIRLRLLDVPLDRDEGEYAYIAQLLLDGVPPFASAYTMKMPGIHAVYALILALLGETPRAIRTGLLLANASAIALVFLLARRLGSPATGLAAALAFAALAISPRMLGLAAYAEHFLLVPVLAGVLVLLTGLETGRLRTLFLSGILLGLGFLLKQSAAFFVVFALALVLLDHAPRRGWRPPLVAGAVLVGGTVLPFAVMCLTLALAGTLGEFWFWTFRYASTYVSAVSFRNGLENLVRASKDILPPVVLIAAVAVIGLARLFVDPALRRHRVVVGLFAAFSLLAVTPGLYFRHHYFIHALPAVAVLAGLAPEAVVRALGARRSRVAIACAAALAAVPAVQTALAERHLLFQAAPSRAARTIYGLNPFPESPVIAEYVQRNTAPGDRIAVIGSEPQIYFYARRRAATAFIYMYPLVERHALAGRLQEQMIRQIETASPEFVVYVHVYTSWLAAPDSDQTLARWLTGYVRHFDRVGVVDLVSQEETRYAWDQSARNYDPESRLWVAVYRRRSEAR
jgi:hypothetical protein